MFGQVSATEKIRIFFSRREALPGLILANVGVWVLLLLVRNFAFLFSSPELVSMGTEKVQITNWLMNNFAVPANLRILVLKPWTLVSYMFMHIEFLHILFNMLWLWWFGSIFVQYLSQRQLLGTYFFGGLAGAIVYIAAFNIFPAFGLAKVTSVALGASASVLAIVTAIAFYVPDYTVTMLFVGQIKIKYIALFTILIDLLMVSSSNAGGHLAHLGGALWGFAYVRMLPGFDPTRIFELFYRKNFYAVNPGRKTRMKASKGGVPLTDEEYNRQKVLKQQKIDHILDKISRSGYESLTKEEKELLFSSSQKKP